MNHQNHLHDVDQEILELLSRSLDESLTEQETLKLQHALARQPELVNLQKTLRDNRDYFNQEVPSAPAFQNLTKLNHYQPRKSIHYGWPLSLAAMFLIAAFLLTLKNMNQIIVEEPGTLNQQVLATQQAFESAINAMEKKADIRLQELPAHIQTTFQQNLVVINLAIAQCERSIPSQDAHYYAYKTLAMAYEAKVRLLEQILRS